MDYTFLDVNFITDRKIRRLRRLVDKHAPGVFIDLLCVIFKEGYYIQWNEDTLLDVADLIGYEEEYITDVVNASLEAGLFSKEMYDAHHILTSHGIQKQYNLVVTKAKKKARIEEFSLLDSSEDKPSNDNPDGIPSERKGLNSEGMQQSILEDNREDKSIVDNTREDYYSSAPSTYVEFAPFASEEQKEKFISYMFFQNWPAANKELEKFLAFNNTGGRKWARMDKTQRESALVLWKPQPEPKQRFGEQTLKWYRAFYDTLKKCNAPFPVLMAALDDCITWTSDSTSVTFTFPAILRDFVESHLASFQTLYDNFKKWRQVSKIMYLCPP